jgi:hypothetical protein
MRLYGQNGAPSIATHQHNGKKVEINVGGRSEIIGPGCEQVGQ